MSGKIEIGKVFYTPFTYDGEIDKYEITNIVDDRVTLLINGEQWQRYTWQLESLDQYSSREEAQKPIDEEIKRIKEVFSTPEKLLNYTYNKVLLATNECSYHDIVAENCLTNLELREYESKCKEFFGITLISEE